MVPGRASVLTRVEFSVNNVSTDYIVVTVLYNVELLLRHTCVLINNQLQKGGAQKGGAQKLIFNHHLS